MLLFCTEPKHYIPGDISKFISRLRYVRVQSCTLAAEMAAGGSESMQELVSGFGVGGMGGFLAVQPPFFFLYVNHCLQDFNDISLT